MSHIPDRKPFKDTGKIGRDFMLTGKLSFCPCEKKGKCSSFDVTLSVALKLTELCLYALGLGYNISLSFFGLDERSQKLMLSHQGYYYDSESGLYILTENAKRLLRDSKFVSTAVPTCIFDCVQMPE